MNENIKNRIKKIRRALTTVVIFGAGVVAGNKINIETTPSEENGINIEVFHKTNSQNIIDQDKLNKALFKAIQKSDMEAVKSLIEQGADINARDTHGRTPIMISVDKSVHAIQDFQEAKDAYDISIYLISQDANLLIKDKDGVSVSNYAAYSKNDGSMMSNAHRSVHRNNSENLRKTIEKVAKQQMHSQAAVAVARASATFQM